MSKTTVSIYKYIVLKLIQKELEAIANKGDTTWLENLKSIADAYDGEGWYVINGMPQAWKVTSLSDLIDNVQRQRKGIYPKTDEQFIEILRDTDWTDASTKELIEILYNMYNYEYACDKVYQKVWSCNKYEHQMDPEEQYRLAIQYSEHAFDGWTTKDDVIDEVAYLANAVTIKTNGTDATSEEVDEILESIQ